MYVKSSFFATARHEARRTKNAKNVTRGYINGVFRRLKAVFLIFVPNQKIPMSFNR